MGDKMDYVVPELQAKSIRKLVESKKYRNPSDFLKNAIEILLTWESEHPEEVMAVMQSLMPFSSEQEGFMLVNNWKTSKHAAVLKTFHYYLEGKISRIVLIVF